MKRMAAFLFLLILLSIPAEATIQWVDFNLSCEAMERALALDMESRSRTTRSRGSAFGAGGGAHRR